MTQFDMLTVLRVMVRYRMGFLCRELNSGLDLERVISYHWTTQEGALSSVISLGCFDQPSFGLWARRASSAPQWLGVSLGGFDPPPLGLLVCIHYTTMGGFDPPPLIPPVCDHTLQRRVLISAPPSHISVTAFTVSRLTTSMTFYPVGIYYH